MMLPPKAWKFIFLNAVRVLSLITLLLVFVSNILVLVDDADAIKKQRQQSTEESSDSTSTNSTTVIQSCDYLQSSTIPIQAAGEFWAITNRCLILVQVIILAFSEIGIPQSLFQNFIPFLAEDSGFFPVGLFQALLGAQILSHHLTTFPMVSAFLLFSVGCLYIICAIFFRKHPRQSRSILGWRRSIKERLPTTAADLEREASMHSSRVFSKASSAASSIFSEKSGHQKQASEQFQGFGFGRQGEKAAAQQGYLVKLPAYAAKI